MPGSRDFRVFLQELDLPTPLDNGNVVAGRDEIAGNIDLFSVDSEVTVHNKLSRLTTADAVSQTIRDVIEPPLQKLQEVVAGLSRHVVRFLEETAELCLVHAVVSSQLLLFAQTDAIFADLRPHLSFGRPRGFLVFFPTGNGAFFREASVSLEKQLAPFRPTQAARRTGISAHEILSSSRSAITPAAAWAVGSRCAEWASLP